MGGLRKVFDVAAAIAVVAAITMMVRPGSNGPQFVAALGTAFVNAAQGTVGATIVPDADIPGTGASSSSSSDTNPVPAQGTALGPIGATYNPSSYNVPGGLHQQRAYW